MQWFHHIQLVLQINVNTFLGYSARAFSSIDVENCHSILNYLELRRCQTSTIEEMTRQISNLLRLQYLSANSELLGG